MRVEGDEELSAHLVKEIHKGNLGLLIEIRYFQRV